MAFLGYKFVGLVISDMARIITRNNVITNFVLGYFCLMMLIFIVFYIILLLVE